MQLHSAPNSAPSRTFSLATRLTLYYALSSFVLVAIVGATLYWALLANLFREDDEFLAGKVEVLREILAFNDSDNWDALNWQVEHAERAPHHDMLVLIRVIDAKGVAIMATPGMDELLPAVSFPPPSKNGVDNATNIYSVDGERRRVMSAKAETTLIPPGVSFTPGDWTLQLALIEQREDEFLTSFRQVLIISLAISVLLCAAVGYTIAKRGLRPLAIVADTVRRIQPSSLKQRVEVTNVPAEIADLTISFNAMMDRLEDSFDRLSRFSADIAHELRTPIHNLRGATEVALGNARTPAEYRDVLISNLEDSAHIAQLIDNLLFIARAENPRTAIQRVDLDVATELVTIRDFYLALADEAGVTLTLDAIPPLPASLDRTLLQRAVGNLLENAIAYTPKGGSVSLHASAANNLLTISVQDTGIGIPPEHLPLVFERFHRADPSRNRSSGGFGLGLSLVRSIATLHGGSATIQSTPNKGTTVTLTFPQTPTPTT